MLRRQFFLKIGLLLGLACAAITSGMGQSSPISLEDAFAIARKNHAGLERDRLSIEQQDKLAKAGLPLQPTQVYISGEEFDFNSQSGVQSLNLQQNFYLPKAAKAQRGFHEKGAALAERQLALTDQELKRQVGQAYYQLLFAKQERALAAENLDLYNNFLSVTTAQLETGETGKIPQLAARSHLGQALLEQEHATEKYQIAVTIFNQWLQADTLYDVQGELPLGSDSPTASLLQTNPHLQVIQAQRELAAAAVETEKAQLLPQINSGLKLQSAFGTFPLFGYQAGVNVPIFKKAYHGRIEAAEVGVKVQEAALKTERQQLERTISELRYRLEHQLHILEYLQNDLTPIVNEQSGANLQAYQEGEIGYLEFLDGLEQVVKVKQQYLTALYQFNALQVEMDYWTGR